jgi:micrococcal nuclease
MDKKRISFLVSLVFSLYLLISHYIGTPSVVQNQQTSSDLKVQMETQNVATTTTSVSTTTQSFFLVSRVVDGDTIEVIKDGIKEKVRLIGINTPETVDPRKKVECFGKEASAHAKEILLGQKVKLVSDDTQTKYDKYGRLLAYVYREDGLFVNKHMISEGYAYEYTYRVPYFFQNEFKEAQLKAQTEEKGLWKVGVCE